MHQTQTSFVDGVIIVKTMVAHVNGKG